MKRVIIEVDDWKKEKRAIAKGHSRSHQQPAEGEESQHHSKSAMVLHSKSACQSFNAEILQRNIHQLVGDEEIRDKTHSKSSRRSNDTEFLQRKSEYEGSKKSESSLRISSTFSSGTKHQSWQPFLMRGDCHGISRKLKDSLSFMQSFKAFRTFTCHPKDDSAKRKVTAWKPRTRLMSNVEKFIVKLY